MLHFSFYLHFDHAQIVGGATEADGEIVASKVLKRVTELQRDEWTRGTSPGGLHLHQTCG